MGFTAVPTYTAGQILTASNLNTYLRDNLNYLVDSSGRLQPTAADHYLGTGAAGGAGDKIHLYGPAAGAGYALVEAGGSDTNVAMVLAGKGLGSLIWQGSSGTTQFAVTSAGAIQALANDHYFGAYALASGTNVSRVHLTAASGGVGAYAEGDTTNVDFHLRQKGAGSFLFENSGGGQLAIIDSSGNFIISNDSKGIYIGSGKRVVYKDTTAVYLGDVDNAGIGAYLRAAGVDKGRITGSDTEWVADNHYFGAYAFGAGTGVSRLHMLTDSASAILEAQGDGADRNMVLRQKGTGGFFVQTAGGTTLFNVTNTGHVLHGSGSTPTVNTYDATVFSSATVSGDDFAGTITLTVKASPAAIAANSQMVVINFGAAFGATPAVLAGAKTNTNAMNTQPWATAISASAFDITATKTYSPGAGVVLTFSYLVVG